jgi:transposase
VLACAEGIENNTVAERLHVTKQTVSKWRGRFVRDRLDGLLDAPRSGAPRTTDDARVEAVVTRTLESKPAGVTQWSTRLMARETGMTQNAILRIWHAFGLQPNRQEAFKLSADPMFVDKVRDIVGLHLNPPLMGMVLGVDEKSQIQALDRRDSQTSGRPNPPDSLRRRRMRILPRCNRLHLYRTGTRLVTNTHDNPRCQAGNADEQAHCNTNPQTDFGALHCKESDDGNQSSGKVGQRHFPHTAGPIPDFISVL